MQAYWALVQRELGLFFKSWTGYVLIAGVMFLLGFSFWSMLIMIVIKAKFAHNTEGCPPSMSAR